MKTTFIRKAHRSLITGTGLAIPSILLFQPWIPLGLGANIAPQGAGIMGVNDAANADAGTPRFHAGVAASIVDGAPTTRVDNWFGDSGGDGGDTFSFVGVVWGEHRTDYVQNLSLTLATFTDGGWFGPNSFNPGAGSDLLVDGRAYL